MITDVTLLRGWCHKDVALLLHNFDQPKFSCLSFHRSYSSLPLSTAGHHELDHREAKSQQWRRHNIIFHKFKICIRISSNSCSICCILSEKKYSTHLLTGLASGASRVSCLEKLHPSFVRKVFEENFAPVTFFYFARKLKLLGREKNSFQNFCYRSRTEPCTKVDASFDIFELFHVRHKKMPEHWRVAFSKMQKALFYFYIHRWKAKTLKSETKRCLSTSAVRRSLGRWTSLQPTTQSR